jgi:hypothetical protein
MNAPHRLLAIQQAKQRISELEQEISVLRQDEDTQRELDFSEKLTKLMKKFSVSPEEVISLLVIRGDLDHEMFDCAPPYKLQHILAPKEIDTEYSADRPEW